MLNRVSIGPGRAEELPALGAVERSASALFLGTHMAWAAGGPTLPRRMLASGLREGLLLVARAPAPVGFIIAAPAYTTLFVLELSVAATHQRRGIGRRLLAGMIARARGLGHSAVTLTTDRDLPWNRPFYASAGFVELDRDTCPDWLVERLRAQARHGNDPARRCAMRLALR